MAMNYSEKELRRLGDKDLAKIISGAHDVFRQRHPDMQDIPLSKVIVAPEAPKVEITPFTQEQLEGLRKEGLLPDYNLTRQSLAALRKARNPFWSTWHKDYPDFEAVPSRGSAVAFNPDKPFLPESNNKTLEQQLEMVARYNQELQQRVPGVMAILGEAPDYAELAFTHFKQTGRRLFGSEHGYNYTRTQTQVGSGVADVGSFGADDGLDVDCWGPAGRGGNLFAAPLVVPVSGTK
ncbi:MAG TPA: hypothetical protein VMR59_02385 [Patescibacteria group bacterium]|jgi:hypothetical protein|nr:hypothetical protein [Patescibacteria group bacterium]